MVQLWAPWCLLFLALAAPAFAEPVCVEPTAEQASGLAWMNKQYNEQATRMSAAAKAMTDPERLKWIMGSTLDGFVVAHRRQAVAAMIEGATPAEFRAIEEAVKKIREPTVAAPVAPAVAPAVRVP